jgi:hypothetical protein
MAYSSTAYDSTEPQPPQPPSPPIGSLGREFVRIQQRPQMVSLVIGIGVGIVPTLFLPLAIVGNRVPPDRVIPTIWMAALVCTAAYVAAVAIIAFLPWFLVSSRDRAASATHAWIGAREVRRVFGKATAAFKMPTTADEANVWLATNPDTPDMRLFRYETYLLARRFDEARALVPLFPHATTFDRFKSAEALALVDELETGRADLAPAEQALGQIPNGLDRVEAAVALAVFEARRLIGRGDWRQPLIRVRPLVPGSDWKILAVDMGMPIFTYFIRLMVVPLASFSVLVALAVSLLSIA